MRTLHVDLGQAIFCQEAAKLQCQATTRARVSTEAASDEEVSMDASSVSSLDLCYRVARPLYFIIGLSFDHSLHWEAQGRVGFKDLLARQLSSAEVSPP